MISKSKGITGRHRLCLIALLLAIGSCSSIEKSMPTDNTGTYMLLKVITAGHKNGRILAQLTSEGFQPNLLEETALSNDNNLQLITIIVGKKQMNDEQLRKLLSKLMQDDDGTMVSLQALEY